MPVSSVPAAPEGVQGAGSALCHGEGSRAGEAGDEAACHGPEKRAEHAVSEIFGHAFHAGTADAVHIEKGSVAADDHGHGFPGFPGLSRLSGIPHAEGVARERDGSEAEPHRNRGHGKTARGTGISGEGREAPRDDGRREDNGEAGEQTGQSLTQGAAAFRIRRKGTGEETPEERFGPGGQISHAADGMDARRRLAEEEIQNEGRRQEEESLERAHLRPFRPRIR